MHVLMILDKEFPPDVRVEREATALLEAGHTVSIVCRNRDGRERHAEHAGLEILRLPPFQRLPGRIRSLLQKAYFFNPVYAFAIRRALASRRCDAIHVHDLPLVALGLRHARRHDVPLIFDLHEDFPAMIRTENRGGIQHLLFTRWDLLGKLERYCLGRADRMLVVTEESRQRLISEGVDPARVTVVGNSVDLESFQRSYPADRQRPPGPQRMLYTGILGVNRGLTQVLEAMAMLAKEGVEVEFHLVGDGEARADIEAQVAELRLQEKVVLHGWKPQAELPEFIADCDFCVIPHQPNQHVQTTLPNKIFEFMAAEKALIVSDARPLANLARAWDCGLVFAYDAPETLAQHIATLVKDPDARRRLGRNGLRAVEEEHQWALEKQGLLSVYSLLASS